MRRSAVASAAWLAGRAAWLPALCLLSAVAASGCGSGEDYEVAPVSGRVTTDGKPLAEVRVTFQPKAKGEKEINPGPGSYATTDEEGSFELRVVGPDREGAVVGMHAVRFSHPDSAKYPFPYSGRNAGMEFEVPPEGTDEANFDFHSLPRRRQ